MIKSLRLPQRKVASDISSMVEVFEQHPDLLISCETPWICLCWKAYPNNNTKLIAYFLPTRLKVEDPKCKGKIKIRTKHQVISKTWKKATRKNEYRLFCIHNNYRQTNSKSKSKVSFIINKLTLRKFFTIWEAKKHCYRKMASDSSTYKYFFHLLHFFNKVLCFQVA